MDKCKDERIRNGAKDLQYCAKHRCHHEDCNGARSDRPFCDKHTCEEETCTSFVSGGGKPGEPGRFCERHRRCKVALCWRFCRLRDNGSVAPFCAKHSCAIEDCDEQRVGGDHCPAHTCVERVCTKGKAGVNTQYCKDHKCANKTCEQRVSGGKYCPLHQCAVRGCAAEAEPDGYCRQHQTCSEAGCDAMRYFLNGTVYPTCERRMLLRVYLLRYTADFG